MAIAKPSSPRVSAVAGPRSGGNPTWRAFSSTSFQRFLGLLLGHLEQWLLEIEFGVGRVHHNIVARGGGRVLLLLVLGLGLVYHLLLLLPLVLVVDGLLVGRYRPLVREAVEDTEGQGGPPENLLGEGQLA